jgi:hypothetical protein
MASQGVKIPTLEALYRASPDAPFNTENKGRRSGIEEAVFRQIEAAGAIETHPGGFRQSRHDFTIPQSQPRQGRHSVLHC